MNVEPWSERKIGDQSSATKGLQYLLRAAGHQVEADGDFGPQTEAAVKAFQSANGIEDDGVVGPVTWPRLVVPTSEGSSGEAVRGVQSFGLVSMAEEPPLEVDGQFGPVTKERVTYYQSSWGLTADGVAGRETWSFLTAEGEVWPLVKPGTDAGWRALPVQYLLREHGATIAADGNFGPQTAEAVRQFQMGLRAKYISDTVGQLDWPELIVEVGPGSSGEAVKAVQSMIPGLATDGEFGQLTENAIKDFQQVFLPNVNGIVDLETWHALVVPKVE